MSYLLVHIESLEVCSLVGRGLYLNCIELAISCIVLQVFLLLIVLVVLCWNLGSFLFFFWAIVFPSAYVLVFLGST